MLAVRYTASGPLQYAPSPGCFTRENSPGRYVLTTTEARGEDARP